MDVSLYGQQQSLSSPLPEDLFPFENNMRFCFWLIGKGYCTGGYVKFRTIIRLNLLAAKHDFEEKV